MQRYTTHLLVGLLVFASACTTRIPQITRFEAPKSITRGEKAVLVWDIEPTKILKNISIANLKDGLPTQGTVEVQPSKPQQYELKIQYISKRRLLTNTRKVTIQVNEPKATFTGTTKIEVGEEALLEWELPNFAKNISLSEWIDGKVQNHWSVEIPCKATHEVKPIKNALYKLEYTDEGTPMVLEHKIEVHSDIFFTGTKRIIAGEEAELIWKTNQNIKDVSLDKKENNYTRQILQGNLPISGSFKINPTQTTEYLLSIKSNEHHTTLLHKVEVVKGMIYGEKQARAGEKTFISWRAVSNAKSIWIETLENDRPTVIYTNLSEDGQIEIRAKASTNYFLAVETAEGVARYEHKLLINEAGIYTAPNNLLNDYDADYTGTLVLANEPNTNKPKKLSKPDDAPITIEPHERQETSTKVLFEFDKSEISADYKAQLDELARQLKKDESAIAGITGHSDLKGTTKGCDRVAKERAENVKKYLIQAGVPEYRIIAKSCGRTFPLHYRETSDILTKENRRAEILIVK